jgi:NAD(P)H-hydrate epimerase
VAIGIPDRSVQTVGATLEWTDRLALDGLLGRRATGSHKGTYGHLLAVAGSCGKAGAAVLVGRGALRAGVGLVTVAAAESARAEVAAHQAEIMTEPLPEAGPGVIGDDAVSRVSSLLEGRQALAIGPGIGTAPETARAVVAILDRITVPVVVDADGLNGIAAIGAEGLAALRSSERETILTPHPGEAARLLGCGVPEVQEDRIASAGELAKRSGAVVVLKGAGTIVAAPDGRAAVNSTGNPGMATAGTGDVLTGIVGALLARGLDRWDAARLGVFAHGLAGDRAAAIQGQEGLVASDVVDALPGAMTSLVA